MSKGATPGGLWEERDRLRAENDALKLRVAVLEKALAERVGPQATWAMQVGDLPGLRLVSVARRHCDDRGEFVTELGFLLERAPERGPVVRAVIDDTHGLTERMLERLRR